MKIHYAPGEPQPIMCLAPETEEDTKLILALSKILELKGVKEILEPYGLNFPGPRENQKGWSLSKARAERRARATSNQGQTLD